MDAIIVYKWLLQTTSHAVIATILGLEILACSVGVQQASDGIAGGWAMPDGGEMDRLLKDRQGRVILAAMILASRLTEDFKFEWQVGEYLGNFDGDDAQLEAINDESVVKEASLILSYLLNWPSVVNYIETVAVVLFMEKGISGRDLRAIVDAGFQHGRGHFPRKEELSWKFPNGKVIMGVVGTNGFFGEGVPCNHYPIRMGELRPESYELQVRPDPFIPNEQSSSEER
jgi:hypothetical protein